MTEIPAPPPPLPDPGPPAERSPRSRTVYVVLALLVGTCGAHNFYAGRWVPGLVQALLTAPSLWMLEGWMKQIQPIAASVSGGDALDAVDALVALSQAGGLPDSPLLLGSLASAVWATVDLFVVKTDGKGRRLR